MGNICCAKCRLRADQRKYLRTRYNVEREISVEFDSLMDDDSHADSSVPQYGAVLTEHERRLVAERKFQDLVQYQKHVDAEIEAQLLEQEEQLKLEEEAFHEAKRHAARVARQMKDEAKKPSWTKPPGSSADEWDIANGEEDFEQFLESVRTRSLNARAKLVTSQAIIHQPERSKGDGADTYETIEELDNSDIATFQRIKVSRQNTMTNAASSISRPKAGVAMSRDDEWDMGEFVSASPAAVVSVTTEAPADATAASPGSSASSEVER